jgi:transcriptional regulator with XRE-family HTH domain
MRRKPPTMTEVMMSEQMSPQAFNKAMGAAIRLEMNARAMTLETLGKAIGVTYQQIGKYAAGQNGLSAFRLQQVAAALHISVAELYERAGAQTQTAEPSAAENDGFLAARYIMRIKSLWLRKLFLGVLQKAAYEGEKAA